MNRYAEPIRSFLVEQHLDGRDDLALDTPLLEWGVLDSLTLVDFLAYIERCFRVEVPTAEVTPDNFATIDAIAALLSRLDRSSSTTPAR